MNKETIIKWREIPMAANQQDIDIAPFIDHSLLNPSATPEQVEQYCAQADRFQFAAVCVYPCHVRQAVNLLHNKKTKICTVIGFPTGASTPLVKLYEAQEAVDNGADELDFVINLGYVKAGKTNELHEEIAQICEETGKPIKAILEMGLLTEPEQRLAAEICMEAGAAYLKTHTGFYGGVTVEDVLLLHEITKGRIGIKAAGRIRTYQQALDLIVAGATRLGTSRGVELIRQRDNITPEND
jgi:deoxyribose-phosphate aldolase